jgi:hypothetical protein
MIFGQGISTRRGGRAPPTRGRACCCGGVAPETAKPGRRGTGRFPCAWCTVVLLANASTTCRESGRGLDPQDGFSCVPTASYSSLRAGQLSSDPGFATFGLARSRARDFHRAAKGGERSSAGDPERPLEETHAECLRRRSSTRPHSCPKAYRARRSSCAFGGRHERVLRKSPAATGLTLPGSVLESICHRGPPERTKCCGEEVPWLTTIFGPVAATSDPDIEKRENVHQVALRAEVGGGERARHLPCLCDRRKAALGALRRASVNGPPSGPRRCVDRSSSSLIHSRLLLAFRRAGTVGAFCRERHASIRISVSRVWRKSACPRPANWLRRASPYRGTPSHRGPPWADSRSRPASRIRLPCDSLARGDQSFSLAYGTVSRGDIWAP